MEAKIIFMASDLLQRPEYLTIKQDFSNETPCRTRSHVQPPARDSHRLWNQIRAAHGVRRPPSTTALAALARLLLKTAEHRGAGLRNGRICWLAAGHRRPATLFDERTLLPGADLLEFDQIRGGIGAVLKLVNANRRQRRHEGGADVFLRLLPCGSAGDPTAPSEADDQGRNSTSRCALQKTSDRFPLEDCW